MTFKSGNCNFFHKGHSSLLLLVVVSMKKKFALRATGHSFVIAELTKNESALGLCFGLVGVDCGHLLHPEQLRVGDEHNFVKVNLFLGKNRQRSIRLHQT